MVHMVKKTIDEFKLLLGDSTRSEQDYQDFIEKHTELFAPPFIQNHGIHFDFLISKFPLDTSRVSDLAYLTKSTIRWWFVLLELESAHKPLFTRRGKPSEGLKDAIAQVDDWKNFVHRHGSEVIRRIQPILYPLKKNKVYFKYAIIIGRNAELENNQSNRDMLDALQRDDLRIVTYDTLISSASYSLPSTKNIVRLEREKFRIKYMHKCPENIFAFLTPEQISVTNTNALSNVT